MRRILAAFSALLLLGHAAAAECVGQNLLATADAETRATLDADLAGVPFATGNLWRATRMTDQGEQMLTILGTYHLDDPRHIAVMEKLSPQIGSAHTVLVEAGPEEEAALMAAMSKNPDTLFISDGPSLLNQMGKEEWQTLTAAMQARGIPSIMVAKMKPWYISMMLGVPPCAMQSVAAKNGLDMQVIAAAKDADISIKALEPYDTVLKLFDTLTPDEQLDMIRATLPLEPRAADFSVTLADSYFAQDSRRMWEYMRLESYIVSGYTPEQVDAEYARMEQILMINRNRSWIPVIEANALEGPLFVAFGALHLSGENGVLNLLKQAGFTVERQAF